MLLLGTDGTPVPAATTDLLALTNADRLVSSLAPVGYSRALSMAAQMKADDMAVRGYFSHQTPEGREPWYWVTKAGYGYSAAGENLAVYFTDTTSVEKAWMASPEHRANLLDPQYRDVGYGIAHGTYRGYDAVFVVQLFGKPKTSTVAHAKVPVRAPTATSSGYVASSSQQRLAVVKGATIPSRTTDQSQQLAFSGLTLFIVLSCAACVFLYTRYVTRVTILP